MESLGLSFWLAAATLLLTIVVTIELLIGNRSVDALRDISPVPGTAPQKVSIIVAARNEQRNIRSALQSLLDLVYPNYELIVVDDRSEDATGKILDAMAASNPRLNVIHVDTLPAGWLGQEPRTLDRQSALYRRLPPVYGRRHYHGTNDRDPCGYIYGAQSPRSPGCDPFHANADDTSRHVWRLVYCCFFALLPPMEI